MPSPLPAQDDLRLEDAQWDALLLALPKLGSQDRRALEAVLYVLSSGTPWLDLPEGWGVSGRTAWSRFKAWNEGGLWAGVLETFLSTLEALERVAWQRALERAEAARTQKHGRAKRLECLRVDVALR